MADSESLIDSCSEASFDGFNLSDIEQNIGDQSVNVPARNESDISLSDYDLIDTSADEDTDLETSDEENEHGGNRRFVHTVV